MKKISWHFRRNVKRKNKKTKHKGHPALVIGESDDGGSFINIGLTHSQKRGHHKNIEIHDPLDWNKKSYLRDDIQIDLKEYLSEVLNDFNLCPEDIGKIMEIINKKNPH